MQAAAPEPVLSESEGAQKPSPTRKSGAFSTLVYAPGNLLFNIVPSRNEITPDDAKYGTIWQPNELDAIVADYFHMLNAELTGQPYVKSRHSAAIMAEIGRSHRSVEFKYQNISAVLDELGMPHITGYRPKRNYQKAIFEAIDRYLTRKPAVLDIIPNLPRASEPMDSVFVPPPAKHEIETPLPEDLKRLIRKFDPVERDHRNRILGRAGEEFVLEIERKHLRDLRRDDLAEKIRWVSMEEGDGAGYDIASFDATGHVRQLEVKTTNGPARTPFFLTRNEYACAKASDSSWSIYRVHLFSTTPRIFEISTPLEDRLKLTTAVWRASF